jgi:dihydroorotate dehydrogenase (NAD+) catalytic subunit
MTLFDARLHDDATPGARTPVPPPLDHPTYRFDLSFEQNAARGPAFDGPYVDVPATPAKDFFGHRVASRFGIAASLLMNERWLEPYSRLGFDLLTYKTVRSRERIAHPVPNWIYVDETSVAENVTQIRTLDAVPVDALNATAAGSIGMPSSAPEMWRRDIRACRAHLRSGQVLIVSVVGTAGPETTETAFADDYARLAGEVREAGAQIVELNLSCPNVGKRESEVYLDTASAVRIARAARAAIGATPLLIKIGQIAQRSEMETLLRALAGIVDGVVMINAPSRAFVNAAGAPAFGASRMQAGLMGGKVFDIALACVRDAVDVVHQDRLELKIIAVGGVCSPERARAFIDAGAYAALAASACAWDPYLAIRVKRFDPSL